MRGLEDRQIRRRLILAGRHQAAVGAQVVVFIADFDLRVVLRANMLDPGGMRIRVAHIFLVHGPRSRQGMIDHGNFVVK
jgi:hypothetical protein